MPTDFLEGYVALMSDVKIAEMRDSEVQKYGPSNVENGKDEADRADDATLVNDQRNPVPGEQRGTTDVEYRQHQGLRHAAYDALFGSLCKKETVDGRFNQHADGEDDRPEELRTVTDDRR